MITYIKPMIALNFRIKAGFFFEKAIGFRIILSITSAILHALVLTRTIMHYAFENLKLNIRVIGWRRRLIVSALKCFLEGAIKFSKFLSHK